jgi:hypothetical protein
MWRERETIRADRRYAAVGGANAGDEMARPAVIVRAERGTAVVEVYRVAGDRGPARGFGNGGGLKTRPRFGRIVAGGWQERRRGRDVDARVVTQWTVADDEAACGRAEGDRSVGHLARVDVARRRSEVAESGSEEGCTLSQATALEAVIGETAEPALVVGEDAPDGAAGDADDDEDGEELGERQSIASRTQHRRLAEYERTR